MIAEERLSEILECCDGKRPVSAYPNMGEVREMANEIRHAREAFARLKKHGVTLVTIGPAQESHK